jgi:hypothetical protein
MTLPLLEYVQQGEVITLIDGELLTRSISLLLPLLGSVEYRRNGKHRDNSEHLGGAFVLNRGNEHFGHRGLHGELGHLTANGSQIADVIKRAKHPKLVHRIQNVRLPQLSVIEASESLGKDIPGVEDP